MTTSFPGGLDNFPNPSAATAVDTATADLDHASQHANANDAIEALQAKVGVNGSAVTTSLDYQVAARAKKSDLPLNPRDYGAVGNGSTDDTTAFQNCLNAAAGTATTASGAVQVPPGFWVTGPLTVPHGVTFKGAGPRATTLILKASTANGATHIKNAQFATMVTIADMRLQGNHVNQSTAVIDGLTIDGGGSNGLGAGNLEYTDARCQVSNVVIENYTGDGLTLAGRGACQVSDVQVWNVKGHGFELGIDSELVNCDAGNSGKNGFHILGNAQLTNCKAWFSGWFDGTQQTANFTSGADFGNGFHWNGSSAAMVNTGLVAQDNARAGFYLDGSSRIVVSGWVSDSNNNNTAAGPTTFANVDITNSYDSRIENGFSFDRNANARRPRWGATLLSGSSNIVLSYTVQGFTNGLVDALDTAAATYGNTIRVSNSDGSTDQAYAASFTPNNVNGSLIVIGALTGNITVNAPTIRTDSPLTLSFVQDATGGRRVTWNAAYNTSWQPDQTPDSQSQITFKWNSSNARWEVVGTGYSRIRPEVANRVAALSITTADTVITSMFVPANSLKIGSTYRARLTYTAAASGTPSVRLRFGTAGTTADTALITHAPVVAAAAGNTHEITFTVTAAPSSSTATRVAARNTVTGVAPSATNQTTTTATPNVNATLDNFLTLTASISASTMVVLVGEIECVK